MPHIKREGLSLHYEQDGNGDPPVMFIHGLCCDHTLFQPQFEYFKASHLVARYPSLPGAVIADDPGPIHILHQDLKFFEGLIPQLEGPESDAVMQAFVEAMFRATDGPQQKRRIVEMMCSVPRRVPVAVIRGVLAWNGPGAIQLCRVPLLVIRSRPTGSNAPDRLLALKPDIHIGITVGAGHFHQLEVPEQVTPMMERFIRIVSEIST
jgi:pimeloyl-ACP methyl ester carboxylesterase